MTSAQSFWLALSGLLPLLGLFGRPADPMLLIYTTFVVVCRWRARIGGVFDRVKISVEVKLFLCFLVSGSLTETLAWLNNYLKAAPQPAVFHPQLIADLILGIGFYGGWAVAWRVAFIWFRFSVAEAFVVTGLQGIFFEQLGAVARMILKLAPSNPPLAALFALYVFAVHGSAAGLALAPVMHHFQSPTKSTHCLRFPAVITLMVGLAFTGAWLAATVANWLGGLPPRQSITAHPFW